MRDSASFTIGCQDGTAHAEIEDGDIWVLNSEFKRYIVTLP